MIIGPPPKFHGTRDILDKMTDDQAAKKWVDANPDKAKVWMAG
jgi:ABC-type proline/glycine betaine transport system substrate-binding protein